MALSSSPPTRTVPSSVSDASPADQLDLVLLEQPADAAGQRRDDLGAALDHGVEVDGRLADSDPELAGLADLAEDVGDTQHRLGGDAGVVQAASADRVLLDDGGVHPQLGGADRGDVAAWPGADHDAVKGLRRHRLVPISERRARSEDASSVSEREIRRGSRLRRASSSRCPKSSCAQAARRGLGDSTRT